MIKTGIVLLVLHASGPEVLRADFGQDMKECQIERANLIEARNFNPKYVKCKKVNIIEQKVK